MATTNSTVPAVKAALVAALTTAINDSTVQVVYGRPQDTLVRREVVYVADVDYTAEVANLKAGRKHYDEDWRVDVVFAVAKPRGAPADSEGRAFALFEFLRDWLADNASGGGVAGVWALTLESVSAVTAHEGEGPVSVVVASVRCRARVE